MAFLQGFYLFPNLIIHYTKNKVEMCGMLVDEFAKRA
jgi:hypothetical protein